MDRSCFVLAFESTDAWTSPAYAPGAQVDRRNASGRSRNPMESLKQIKIVNVA